MRKLFQILIVALLLSHVQSVDAQRRVQNFSISNNATSLPVTGYPVLFYANFHPGADWQFQKSINQSETNRLNYVLNGGFIYHRFVQTLLYGSASMMYERKLSSRLHFNISLGVGFGNAFSNEAVARLNDQGEYEAVRRLYHRPQFLILFQPGFSYSLSKEKPDGIRLTANFRTMLQGVFVKQYVPLLPINSFMLGVTVPFKTTKP
ncbi:MAG: hypothetical protein ACK4GL_08400 [Flavobacteriales bacterium]